MRHYYQISDLSTICRHFSAEDVAHAGKPSQFTDLLSLGLSASECVQALPVQGECAFPLVLVAAMPR